MSRMSLSFPYLRASTMTILVQQEALMVRLGGAASPAYISVFRGLQTHFRQHGIALDWVLYADYDALVEAFIKREIDLAWNSPISYVHELVASCHECNTAYLGHSGGQER